MSLRFKVALWLVAIVLPVVTAFSMYRIGVEKRFVEERTADRIASRLIERSPRRCEFKGPRIRGRKRFRGEVYGYDASYSPILASAPAYPEALKGQVDDEPVHRNLWRGPKSGVTAVKIQNDVCPNVVIFWPDKPLPPPAVRSVVWQTILLLLVLVLTGLGIALPIVRRLRKLSDAVRSAPDKEYRVEVELDREDEIGELARAFNATGEVVNETISDLQARDEALKAYIANTTHDLAIPLTVLQHRLRKAVESEVNEEVQGHLNTAMEESHYMAALVKNLNVTAKLDAADLYFETHPQDLAELVERVATRHQPIADLKGVELNVAVPESLTVECDPTLAEQAISNIVQNAIQYTPSGGHVAVVLDAVDARFELRVMDDGPGIASEVVDRVFERAVRADEARTRNPEGLGLGLAITLNVFQLHDWSIEMQSEDGLTVIVTGPKQDS